MAAIQPDLPIDPSTRSRRARGTARQPSLALRVVGFALALVSGAAGLFIATAYPIAPMLVVALFAAWTIFAFARFSDALPTLLAVLPVLAFATWTGWLTFEELDLAILASSAGGYAALALRARTAEPDRRPDRPTLSIFSIALIVLFLASSSVSLVRGIDAAGPFRFGWFQGYNDALNSLRVYKSFFWVVLMTPLVIDEMRKPRAFDRIGLGLTIALGLGCLAVLQERLAFTGLLDFSDDYRVTGSFWEMHVGGAALDGFLALTIPFAIREAVRNMQGARDPVRTARFATACVVLALAGYACLVTFSRGVYLAIPVALLMLVVLVSRQHIGLIRREAGWATIKAGVFAVLVALSAFVVFRAGGYRAVLAVLGVVAIAIPIEAELRRARLGTWVAAVVAALLLAAAGHVVAGVLPKGPYLMYGAAFAAALGAIVRNTQKPSSAMTLAAIAAWLWLSLAACLVALHWGGDRAFADSAKVIAPWVLLSFAISRRSAPLWPRLHHQQLATVGLATLVMGTVAVFTAGAYMGNRFASTNADLDLRTSHWREGMARLQGSGDWLLGVGLGRFPATSIFDATNAEMPGGYHLATRDGETFLDVSAPRMKYLGFGELFRVSQRVDVQANTAYTVTLTARSAVDQGVHVELCHRHLLYPTGCTAASPKIAAGLDRWRTVVFTLHTSLDDSSWYQAKPSFLAIAAGDPMAVLEVRSVSMIGPDGVDRLANGDFANGTAHWFSSSDKFHLPWHMKNIVLAVLFDQGAIGLALFTMLVGGALLRTTVGRTYRHPDAPYVAAAIGGYLAVGMVDSLLDVPRVAFAFYFVVLLGLMLRNPRVAKGGASPAPSAPAVPTVDEAAARAKRRQEAFGRRGSATD